MLGACAPLLPPFPQVIRTFFTLTFLQFTSAARAVYLYPRALSSSRVLPPL